MAKKPDTKDYSAVPATACMFVGGEVEFKDNGEAAKTVGVRMKARDSGTINHFWWGNIAHEFSGMKHKNRIPIDYAHDTNHILGYVNKFETEPDGLYLSGALTPFKDGDMANEVIFKMKAGVPYEASIYFNEGQLLRLSENESAEVNGKTVKGPAVIVKKWNLRGVAICPYGADASTKSNLFKDSEEFIVMDITLDNDSNNELTATAPVEAAGAVAAPAAVETPEEGELAADAPTAPVVEGAEATDTTNTETEVAAGTDTAAGGGNDNAEASVEPEPETSGVEGEDAVDAASTEVTAEVTTEPAANPAAEALSAVAQTPETTDTATSQQDMQAFATRLEAEFGPEVALSAIKAGMTYEEALRLAYDTQKAALEAMKADAAPAGGKPAQFSASAASAVDGWKAAQKKSK